MTPSTTELGDIANGVGSWSDSSNNVKYEGNSSSVFTGSGYVHTGVGGSIDVNTGSNRGMQSSLGGALSGEFWVSGMTREFTSDSINVRSGSVLAFNNNAYSATSATGAGFGVGLNGDPALGGDREIGIWGGSSYTSTTTGAAIAGGDWYLFFARIVVNASGNDTMDIWSFENDAAVPTTVAGLGTAAITGSGEDFFGDSVSNIWAGAASPATSGSSLAQWDDIRVSNLSGQNGLSEVLTGSAVPEPSSTMMLICGLGAVVGFRRRS